MTESFFKERLLSIIENLEKLEPDCLPEQHKRNYERHSFRSFCHARYVEVRGGKISFCNPESPLFGLTRNISCGGMALLTKRLFVTGDIIETEVFLNQTRTVYFLGRATFSRFCGDNIYETGIQFSDYRNCPILVGNQDYIEHKVRSVTNEYPVGPPDVIHNDYSKETPSPPEFPIAV